MVVCGITRDYLIEDIKFSVPKGHAVTIPVDLVLRSVDLHRALSQGILFQLNTHSLMRLKFPRTPGGVAEEERFANDLAKQMAQRSNAESEASNLKQEKVALEAENARLREELVALRSENAKLASEAEAAKGTEGKLDQMLALLKERPATVIQTVTQGTFGKAATSEPVEDDAPKFIPSQIRPDSVDASRISVQEGSTESGGVASAADALKRFRKQPSGQ